MLRRLRSLSIPQRIVIVLAVGLALAIGWAWWYSGETALTGGWFSYAPGTGVSDDYFVVQRRQPEHLLVPIALVVLWAAASLWLLGLGSSDDEDRLTPR